MHSPSVAIVILNWNGRHFLEKFLPGVLASGYERMQVIVADNNSADDSVAFVEAAFPMVRLVRFQGNMGFAAGYNEALKGVDADYFMLLNSDVEITPGWLQPMVSLLEQSPENAACQPKIRSWHRRNEFEYAGACGGWLDFLGYPFCRGRVFETCEQDHGQYDSVQQVFWATGAAMLVRSRAFHQAGGFDPAFFAHQEEIDLCWRLQLLGYRVFCHPGSVVYHVGGGTLPRGNSRKTFLNFRNNLLMLARNLPWAEKWWKLPVRMLLDQVAAVRHLVSGDAGYFAAIFRAHLAFAGMMLSGRLRFSRTALPVERLAGVSGKSVVAAYFLRGLRYFSDIVK